jgi:hypothetical protein
VNAGALTDLALAAGAVGLVIVVLYFFMGGD